jgi:hypothetical protein
MGMLTWLLSRHRLVEHKQDVHLAETDTHCLYTLPLDDFSKVEASPYKPKAVVSRPKKGTKKPSKSKPKAEAHEPGSDNDIKSVVQGVLEKFRRSISKPAGSASENTDKAAPIGVERNVRWFADPEDAVSAFPKVKSLIDWLYEQLWEENSGAMLHTSMIPMGYTQVGNRNVISGYVASATGEIHPLGQVLCVAREYIGEVKYVTDAMPHYEDEDDALDLYPLIAVVVKRVGVRPSGEIILDVMIAPYSKPALMVDCETDDAAWVMLACDDGYASEFSDEQLDSLWDDLRVASDFNDDIPF